MAVQDPRATKPKAALVVGAVLVIVSVVVFAAGIVWGVLAVNTTVSDAEVFRSPGETTVVLDGGDHALWTPEGGGSLAAADVTINGPTGAVPASDYVSANANVTTAKGGETYVPDIIFTAPVSGAYTVVVGPGGPAVDVLVGPSTETITRSFVVIAVSIGVAGLVGLVGVVVLIVGLVQRTRGRPPARPTGDDGPGSIRSG
jgi:hypothetical protein